jgi:N-acylglucosamine 2-epimerase
MKLWWPHCEAMIATLMSHKITGKSAHWEQFKKVLHYSFENVS